MRGERREIMNNISIEQRREAFNVFLKSDEFNDALEIFILRMDKKICFMWK